MTELLQHIEDLELKDIAKKVFDGQRINMEEGMVLYTRAGLPLLGLLAGSVRERKNGRHAFFNRNFHIEPTNRCIYNCRFCSYHKDAGDPESWEFTPEEIMEIVRRFDGKPVTEVHIVGAVHPSHDLHYYGRILKMIKEHRPGLHIKAFSAVELDYMIRIAGMPFDEGLRILKDYGLDSIPGGGAEIFDEEIRRRICPEKTSSRLWLEIHETAHLNGIPSNATMLYGHMENYSHRIDHMERIRSLQDKTGGFNAFIPLKYRKKNNPMSALGEVSMIEDLRNYAVARIYLDNIPHIKAYWPMTGKAVAQIALSFGADDMDGTIDDTTKIYSMAGASDENPAMSTGEISSLISDAGYIPVERDSLYNPVG
ncbi:MAG: aminofutalosine synthase MqnE [Bacteroidales bacterium]|jgi:aminodeoxyfutalosine synthase|nr:aminofutalosine synthase MqnE [Bacteroidales bacterium]